MALEDLSKKLDSIKLSGDIKKTQIDENIAKFKEALKNKNKKDQLKALNNLEKEITDYLNNKNIEDQDKKELKEIKKDINQYKTQLDNLKKEIKFFWWSLITITDKDIIKGLDEEKKHKKKILFFKDPWWWIKQNLFWWHIFSNITHTIESWFWTKFMSADSEKVSKFFEKIWYWESSKKAESIEGMLQVIEKIKYSDFEKKINEMLKDADNKSNWLDKITEFFKEILNELGIEKWLNKDQEESVKYFISFIKDNKELINSKLWSKKSDATMKDVIDILFDNNITDMVRNYAMPTSWVKIKEYAKII